ncbi:hypothetical protein [Nocardia sp. NPDC050789]
MTTLQRSSGSSGGKNRTIIAADRAQKLRQIAHLFCGKSRIASAILLR